MSDVAVNRASTSAPSAVSSWYRYYVLGVLFLA